MKQILLLALAKFGMQRYRLVFGCCIVLAAVVVTLFVLNPPHIESDVLDLLPTHNPIVQDFKQATTDFKSLDLLFVLFETDDPGKHHISEFEDFADEMAHRLRESGMVEGVEYRLQDYQGLVEAMLPYTLLYLDPDELEEVGRQFTDSAIADQVAANRVMISNPASLLTKDLIQYDPFGLFPILKKHFVGKTQQLDVDLSDGYYLSRDGRHMLMMVRPVKPAQNIPFGKKLMARIRGYDEDIRRTWLEEGDDSVTHLSLSYGGGYPIAQDDANLIKRDAVLNTAVSVSLVLIIYVWAFRRRSALVYGWVPLVFGLLMTFGLAYILGVTLNSATAGFGALLIGLGIDFSTVMYGRFIEERNRGRGVDASIASMMRRTGQGVVIGAVTTAATFGAMILTEFSGMRQVGILTASGILVCGLCMFVLLPAMLKVHQLHKTKKGLRATFHMNVFGIEKLGVLSHRHPLAVLILAGIATAGLAVASADVDLEDNIQNLRSPDNTGILVSEEVHDIFGATITYMMVMVDGNTPDDVVSKSDAILEAIEPFKEKGDILFTDSLAAYLPRQDRQRRVLEILEEGREDRFSYERITEAFNSACRKEGFDPAYFSVYLETLQRMVRPDGPVSFDTLDASPLKPLLRKYILRKGEESYRGVIYLFIPRTFKRNAPAGLVETVSAAVPEAKVVGINRMSGVLRALVKHDALKAFIVGTLLVFLIIMLDFRSAKAAFFALLPLAVGVVWMLGTLRLLDEPLNIMNIFVSTMIIGIGSDYGIHLVHRYREKGPKDIHRIMGETGKPIVIAALTTIAAFGSMSLSAYPGLRSMGYVALLGTLYCMVATLTVLVAALSLAERDS